MWQKKSEINTSENFLFCFVKSKYHSYYLPPQAVKVYIYMQYEIFCKVPILCSRKQIYRSGYRETHIQCSKSKALPRDPDRAGTFKSFRCFLYVSLSSPWHLLNQSSEVRSYSSSTLSNHMPLTSLFIWLKQV